MYFEKLWTEFSKLQEVEAIVLGGSRAMDNFDEKSDYDLYIYCSEIPAINIREQILTSTCNYMEVGNHFWELEDDCTLKDGVDIDILYGYIYTGGFLCGRKFSCSQWIYNMYVAQSSLQ